MTDWIRYQILVLYSYDTIRIMRCRDHGDFPISPFHFPISPFPLLPFPFFLLPSSFFLLLSFHCSLPSPSPAPGTGIFFRKPIPLSPISHSDPAYDDIKPVISPMRGVVSHNIIIADQFPDSGNFCELLLLFSCTTKEGDKVNLNSTCLPWKRRSTDSVSSPCEAVPLCRDGW